MTQAAKKASNILVHEKANEMPQAKKSTNNINNENCRVAPQTNLNDPNLKSATNKKEEQSDWVKVVRKPKKQPTGITGTRSEVTIKAAPRKAFLYVSRLSPTTKQEELTSMVTKYFPEADLEQLDSKYPQYYSSFKVMINLANVEQAMNPEIWPEGCYVTRFFHPRRKNQVSR